MCQFEREFDVMVISSGRGTFTPEELFSIVVGLVVLLLIIAIILAHLY